MIELFETMFPVVAKAQVFGAVVFPAACRSCGNSVDA